jgi:hypothetical protein
MNEKKAWKFNSFFHTESNTFVQSDVYAIFVMLNLGEQF